MALISCNECGHDVSTRATACTNCGAPVVNEPGAVVSTVDHGQSYCAIKHEKIARSRRRAAQPCPHCGVPLPAAHTAVRIGLDANGAVVSLTTPEPRPFVAWSKRSTSATGSQGEDRDPDLLPSEQSASTFRIGSFNVRRNLVIAVVVAVLFVGVGLISESSLFSGTSTSRVSGGTQTDRYVAEYGGVESVYRGILNTADCTSLQASFDRAADNNDRAEPGSPAHRYTLGYMTAADDRMEQIGCYG